MGGEITVWEKETMKFPYMHMMVWRSWWGQLSRGPIVLGGNCPKGVISWGGGVIVWVAIIRGVVVQAVIVWGAVVQGVMVQGVIVSGGYCLGGNCTGGFAGGVVRLGICLGGNCARPLCIKIMNNLNYPLRVSKTMPPDWLPPLMLLRVEDGSQFISPHSVCRKDAWWNRK